MEMWTSAWYGDRLLELPLPPGWQVDVRWPATPSPLTEEAVVRALRDPVGQPPISVLARGCRRPLVIVDDLTRPTPAGRVLPHLLAEFRDAGVPAQEVTVLVATGTHGAPPPGAVAKKIGAEAAAACRVRIHDDLAGGVRIGRTSYGTPVVVDPEVVRSDFVVGLGGIYPQHSTGFGGGSKLALGVLARRSITHLHYGHPSMEGSYDVENDFRRDLDEIAEKIRLRTSISAHVDGERQLVRLVSGDHAQYYRDEVAWARAAYAVPLPGDADVVVSNAYPMDVSLTFMRSKGILPVLAAAPGASRVVVAGCPEGVGHHGLYPFVDVPRFGRVRHALRLARFQPARMPAKAVRRARSKVGALVQRRPGGQVADRQAGSTRTPGPVWLYPPGALRDALPATIPGMRAEHDWDRLVGAVRREQGDRDDLRVVVYPCAPLQVLGASVPLDDVPVPLVEE